MIATADKPTKVITKKAVAGKRLLSVDALRGFDMLWIIGGGDIIIALAKAHPNNFTNKLAEHFDHQWGQFHFYDIIMPLFLFIVGVVMPVAFKVRMEKGDTKKQIYIHALKRVVRLYILGLIASGHLLSFDIQKIHLWTDTLHAIAIGYIVSSVLILELNLKWQIGITAFLLLAYWAVIALIPVPGYPPGMFEPTINLPLYVDNLVLGHFQEGEGWTYILTNMTFVCSVMLGVFAGYILQSNQTEKKKAARLIFLGIGCLVVGKIWGIWFPIIHHLWTSSLVLYAAGWSYLLLALFYLVIDVYGYKKWAFPLVVIGMNAIAVYVATHLFHFELIGNVFVGGLSRGMGAWKEFVQEVAALIVVWLILYWMYKKKTFIKV
jgi:predicted acyltransferase